MNNYYIIGILIIIIICIIIYKIVFKNNKKIALCFLIYDKIIHEDLWYQWLKNVDKNKYNIYIHYKENKPLKYFEKYKIKENIPTKYADVSLIHAHNLLFKNALKDNNYKIISLSQNCIPVKSFDYVYKFLTNDNFGHFSFFSNYQIFPRGNELLNYYNRENIKKSNNWFILNKTLAKSVINNSKNNIDKKYKNIISPEEYYFITHIYTNNLQNQLKTTYNSCYGTTFAGWSEMTDYKIFDKSKLLKPPSSSWVNEYDEICNEELEYLVNSKCLFARKFTEKCDLQYLYKLLKI